MFGANLPELAKAGQVIAVHLQAHRRRRPPHDLRGDGRRHSRPDLSPRLRAG
jgi:hypothetical protein